MPFPPDRTRLALNDSGDDLIFLFIIIINQSFAFSPG